MRFQNVGQKLPLRTQLISNYTNSRIYTSKQVKVFDKLTVAGGTIQHHHYGTSPSATLYWAQAFWGFLCPQTHWAHGHLGSMMLAAPDSQTLLIPELGEVGSYLSLTFKNGHPAFRRRTACNRAWGFLSLHLLPPPIVLFIFQDAFLANEGRALSFL